MDARDEKIKREILQVLYYAFKEEPYTGIEGKRLFDELSEYADDDIRYIADRIDGEYADVRIWSQGRLDAQITHHGIEHLYELGSETILETETRYEILQDLYEADRGNLGRNHISRDDLVDEVDASEETVDQNIWYLKEKGLIETSHGGGGLFYHSAGISDEGRDRYEAYRDDGVEIPSSSAIITQRQASIGPDEPDKAENLFRDIVELASGEVLILDRYARKELYELLEHVPTGVNIRVLTTDIVTGESYSRRVQQFADDHPKIDVRSLTDGEWDFHDRYLFRDDEMGWAWGHSFHDAGDTQHTASELRPVNREQLLTQFEEAWEDATSVM